MLSDVRNYYGLARDFGQAGYFETEHSEQIVSELKLEIKAGKLVALSGIVGCGKTTMLRRIQEALSQDKEILASKSLSLEKSQISLATLIMALFYDLATEKDFKIPTQPERRERALRDLIKKRQKPIALFIDDAHDLQPKRLSASSGLSRWSGTAAACFRWCWPAIRSQERSAPVLDGRDRFPRDGIRIGGLGEREAEVSQVVAGTIACAQDED
jgi:ABC-type dipeptide/oligopeptide/nickel transport system ATPase component